MTLTKICTLIGLAGAALLAWSLGGGLGAGVLAGFVTGALLAGFSVARQRRILRASPQHALRAMVEGFLMKLGALVVLALLLVLVAPLRAQVDPRTTLLAYAAAVLVVLLPGTVENARVLKGGRAP